jgi:hypothetical protein
MHSWLAKSSTGEENRLPTTFVEIGETDLVRHFSLSPENPVSPDPQQDSLHRMEPG